MLSLYGDAKRPTSFSYSVEILDGAFFLLDNMVVESRYLIDFLTVATPAHTHPFGYCLDQKYYKDSASANSSCFGNGPGKGGLEFVTMMKAQLLDIYFFT